MKEGGGTSRYNESEERRQESVNAAWRVNVCVCKCWIACAPAGLVCERACERTTKRAFPPFFIFSSQLAAARRVSVTAARRRQKVRSCGVLVR